MVVPECALTYPDFTWFTQGSTLVKVYLNGYYVITRSQTQKHCIGVCVRYSTYANTFKRCKALTVIDYVAYFVDNITATLYNTKYLSSSISTIIARQYELFLHKEMCKRSR
jgi:hypothetical protein